MLNTAVHEDVVFGSTKFSTLHALPKPFGFHFKKCNPEWGCSLGNALSGGRIV